VLVLLSPIRSVTPVRLPTALLAGARTFDCREFPGPAVPGHRITLEGSEARALPRESMA